MSLRRVLFQPDYFMSAQFAGLAVALRGGAYTRAGIEVQVLPLAGAGESAEEIQSVGRDTSGALVVGSTEQNILIPAQRGGAPVQAVASMFGTSPLSLAGLPGLATGSFGDSGMRIGVHDDTVDLVKRLLPSADVVSVGREDKMGMLIGGKLDAVQVYDCMETLKMERDLGAPPSLLPLEGLGGARLGYAQVLFASDASLADPERRALLRGFLQATFEGWHEAHRAPRAAAEAVMATVAALGHQTTPSKTWLGAETDGWEHSLEGVEASVVRCSDYARRARCAGMLGAIDAQRWAEASEWLGGSGGRTSLDPTVWAPDPLLLDGDSIAARLMQQVGATASRVSAARGGAAPRLGLVTVGQLAEGHTGDDAGAREQLAPDGQSWFNKKAAGERHGVAVEQVDLPHATSTAALQRTLRSLARRCDGIQLMWPLPSHIDSVAAYNTVPAALDVDGAHFVGHGQLRAGRQDTGGVSAGVDTGVRVPVTPESVLQLLAQGGVDLASSHVVVIGRSRIVGAPLAHALLAADATVSVAHRHTPSLEALCRSADVVISCAGVPGLIKGGWIRPGGAVVNVGITYCEQSNSLQPDLEADLEAFRHARFVASAPGGVGPLSLALLFRNVADAAERRSSEYAAGADSQTPQVDQAALDAFLQEHPHWSIGHAAELPPQVSQTAAAADGSVVPPVRSLVRTLKFETHGDATALLGSAGEIGDRLDHHIAHSAIEHRCTHGVQLTVHAYTTSTGEVTAHDLELCRQIEAQL